MTAWWHEIWKKRESRFICFHNWKEMYISCICYSMVKYSGLCKDLCKMCRAILTYITVWGHTLVFFLCVTVKDTSWLFSSSVWIEVNMSKWLEKQNRKGMISRKHICNHRISLSFIDRSWALRQASLLQWIGTLIDRFMMSLINILTVTLIELFLSCKIARWHFCSVMNYEIENT